MENWFDHEYRGTNWVDTAEVYTNVEVYATGSDHCIWKQNLKSMNASSAWTKTSKGDVMAVAIQGNWIFGVGMNHHLYKQKLSTMTTKSAWTKCSGGEGVDTHAEEKARLTKASVIHSYGSDVMTKSPGVKAICVFDGGYGRAASELGSYWIYGVGTDGQIYHQKGSEMTTSSQWKNDGMAKITKEDGSLDWAGPWKDIAIYQVDTQNIFMIGVQEWDLGIYMCPFIWTGQCEPELKGMPGHRMVQHWVKLSMGGVTNIRIFSGGFSPRKTATMFAIRDNRIVKAPMLDVARGGEWEVASMGVVHSLALSVTDLLNTETPRMEVNIPIFNDARAPRAIRNPEEFVDLCLRNATGSLVRGIGIEDIVAIRAYTPKGEQFPAGGEDLPDSLWSEAKAEELIADADSFPIVLQMTIDVSRKQTFLKLFAEFDDDKNMSMSFGEFRNLMMTIDESTWNLKSEQWHALMESFDLDGDGQIDIQEFIESSGTRADSFSWEKLCHAGMQLNAESDRTHVMSWACMEG
eukprot:TRINITY_DN105755_c0_g1_i1.p1 TRINITY_DN105755_c0_g1~~TRINITY_DN105755_c0_g1_i1.p1  ORF type:complete len:550 (-),score=66.18 TRINITY_DN105755_c0_g1_i1:6-1565(-)